MASIPRERDLPVDRLPADAASPIDVLLFEDATFGIDVQGAREPHRHDYHEVFWTRAGEGHHLIDGRRWPVRPGTVTLIGRGQVHVLERPRPPPRMPPSGPAPRRHRSVAVPLLRSGHRGGGRIRAGAGGRLRVRGQD